jgi:trehalose 6-phosphate phosphatase
MRKAGCPARFSFPEQALEISCRATTRGSLPPEACTAWREWLANDAPQHEMGAMGTGHALDGLEGEPGNRPSKDESVTSIPDLPPPPQDLLDGATLFLDFDGTLVDLVDRPEDVHVDERLHRLMRGLLDRLDGRVALVSGRPALQLVTLFGTPDFAISGSHGVEFHYPGGRHVLAERPAALEAVTAQMHAFAGEWDGMLVEEKPLGAALHYRQVPQAEEAAVAFVCDLAERHDLAVQPGKMMIEARVAGGDKGSAIRRLLEDASLARGRPLFLGDDLTDEPGFAAVEAMQGAGILIGAPRPTEARYRLPDVRSTLDWLEAASACVA